MEARIAQLNTELTSWYETNRRDLPWRQTRDPYSIWISEVMLQQTRAVAVIPYYHRFLSALPDVESLARADDDELMKLWEGLGYYSRARNLKKAAQAMVEQYNGKVPETPELLRKLPGFGPYTSASVAAFAYGHPSVPVDGNVARLYARFYGITEDIREEHTKSRIREIASTDLCSDPRVFGQALIELGAVKCVPSGPDCEGCPLRTACFAYRVGKQEELPFLSRLRPRKIEKMCVLLICCDGKYVLSRRPEKGLLAGLYQFPNFNGNATEKNVISFTRKLGAEPIRLHPLPARKHVFTHVEWHMSGWRIDAEQLDASLLLATPDELRSRFALPTAFACFLPDIPGLV